MWTNLFFTCVSEEALFRGIIQRHLERSLNRFRNGAWLALGAAAVCFGLAHFGGGFKVRDPGHGGRVGVWNHLPAHRKHRCQHYDPLWPQHHPFYLFHLSSLGDGAELKARFRFLHLVQAVLGDGIVPICPCSILSASREAAKNAKGAFKAFFCVLASLRETFLVG